MLKSPRLCRVGKMSKGGEFHYLTITGWLTESLGKIHLHVCGILRHPGVVGLGKCTRMGNYPGHIGWVINHMLGPSKLWKVA